VTGPRHQPSRVPDLGCGTPGVVSEAREDGVADLPLKRAQGLPVRFALGRFLAVVGASLTVRLPDLGDGGHVDGVVDPAVPAPGQR